jgi:hypothetical protein
VLREQLAQVFQQLVLRQLEPRLRGLPQLVTQQMQRHQR